MASSRALSWLLLLVAGSGPLGPSAILTAQTLPIPALPPETTGGATSTPGARTPPKGPPPPPAVESPVRPPPWEYALGVGASWDTNMEYPNPDGDRGYSVEPRGALARVFWSPRAQLKAGVAGRWIGHPDPEQASRSYVDFALDGSYRSSQNTTWGASAGYGIGYSDSSKILLDQGVLLPLVNTRTLAGSVGLTRRMGTRTSLKIDGRIFRTEFDSPDLVDGESLRGTVTLERQLGLRGSAAFAYSLEDVADPSGRSYLSHFGSLLWTRVLSPRSAFLLEAGASYTPDALRAGLGRPENFFGGFTFRRQVKKRSSLTAFVRREVAPAFGTGGSRLGIRVGLSAAIPMGRDWDFRTGASYIRPEVTRRATETYASSGEAALALARRLGRYFEVSAEGSYRSGGATSTLPVLEAFHAGLFLTLKPSGGR